MQLGPLVYRLSALRIVGPFLNRGRDRVVHRQQLIQCEKGLFSSGCESYGTRVGNVPRSGDVDCWDSVLPTLTFAQFYRENAALPWSCPKRFPSPRRGTAVRAISPRNHQNTSAICAYRVPYICWHSHAETLDLHNLRKSRRWQILSPARPSRKAAGELYRQRIRRRSSDK